MSENYSAKNEWVTFLYLCNVEKLKLYVKKSILSIYGVYY